MQPAVHSTNIQLYVCRVHLLLLLPPPGFAAAAARPLLLLLPVSAGGLLQVLLQQLRWQQCSVMWVVWQQEAIQL
jgi:hypothetical protein